MSLYTPKIEPTLDPQGFKARTISATRITWRRISGPSTCEAAERWYGAHLPSALARRHGHEACAVELEELGL